MVRAAVPEAPVHEDGDPLPGEDDVRASGRRFEVDPISEAPPPEQSAKDGLGPGISFRIGDICWERERGTLEV